MSFELKTDFDSLDAAISYLKGDVSAELSKLEAAAGELGTEKTKLIAKRDELLGEVKALKSKYKKFEGHEDVDIDELLSFKAAHEGDEESYRSEVDKKYKSDKAKFEARIAAIEKEREAEKQQAEEARKQQIAAQLKADAIAEFSQEQHKIIRPDEFWILFGQGKIERDEETGNLYAEADYKKLSLADYIAHIGEEVSHQHHFRASGNSGSGGGPGKIAIGKTKKWSQMNLTERSMLYQSNKDKAIALAGEEGITLS